MTQWLIDKWLLIIKPLVSEKQFLPAGRQATIKPCNHFLFNFSYFIE